jgi:hypothetical protein
MLAWIALLVRDFARRAAPLSESLGPAPRLAPARARLPRRIAARAPRRRTIEL